MKPFNAITRLKNAINRLKDAIKRLYQKLSYYPRFRVVIIILGLILLTIVFINVFTGTPNTNNAPRSSINTPIINLTTNRKVGENKYKALAHEHLAQKRSEDASSGKSFVEGVFNDGKLVQQKTSPTVAAQSPAKSNIHAMNPVKFFKQQKNEAEEKVRLRQETIASAEHNVTVDPQKVTDLENQMSNYLDSAKSAWQLPTGATVQVSSDDDNAGSYNDESGATAEDKNVMIKAGDIMYAVMETEVNSDLPGPIMATIVSGKYKDAKLLGTFARPQNGDKLIVKFNRMSIKGAEHTISIDAYAVDAVSAQNALASDVNHHYLFRYGSLLAGAFLQGFGNAYADTSICRPGSFCLDWNGSRGNANTKTTAKTAAYQGLGQVGQRIGEVWQSNFDVPPTIKIHQGTGMGILFMQDITPQGISQTAKTTPKAPTQPGETNPTTQAIENIMSGTAQNIITGSMSNAASRATGGNK